ncbi:sensor histidine kinase [Dehalogenimonas etheniformans]|uniref:sensor histidine kinase n=1 Tax=Dehalogenimonas etheniformans TaxID=1536648 RepID=UPI000CA6C80B|nr:HAMP domain-containing sensor histidine kinase [Dehalogenimonas etheniformans]QNT76027.1 HAMP domain-containing histidine kinase [Dehalogenimonas etheniformans]
MVRSFEQTRKAVPEEPGDLNITDALNIYEENPNPVLRISNDGIILYYNRSSQFLCDSWESRTGDRIPETYRQRIEIALKEGKPKSYKEVINGFRVVLQIVPILTQNYVDVFGYCQPNFELPIENRTKAGIRGVRNDTRITRQTEFARAAVHELRNPLTPILAASEMLVNRLDEGAPARLARQINASATELNARIGELFELVQAETGAFALNYQTINIKDIVREIVESFLGAAGKKGVQIINDVDGGLPEIQADGVRLKEAIGYLIENAISRCESKAIIRFTGMAKQNSVVFKIKVTCLKIPPAISTYLSSTGQVNPMDRYHFSSVGLKLTLAKLLIELHSGDIHVENENDCDIFTIRVPIGENSIVQEDPLENLDH